MFTLVASMMVSCNVLCSDTSGKYAYACGSTWADAHSFAGAAYEAYASAWADVQGAGSDYNYCDCGVDVYAQADVVRLFASAPIQFWDDLAGLAAVLVANCALCMLATHSMC
jgi:hypothetical protein